MTVDLDTLWFGRGAAARLARAALTPAELLYCGVVGARNTLFDAGWMATAEPVVPCVSVGNLSVGGTGKTPMAAALARRLTDAGARPAIVMRGYGGDEPSVHSMLNPDVPVLTSRRRAVAIADARARGCDVVVLDDAFQHRGVGRLEDLVLVAAEQWRPGARPRCLPAGPYREPVHALARATCVLVTRKSARADEADAIARALRRVTDAPVGCVVFALDTLRRVGDEGVTTTLSAVRGARVLAVAGIGAPVAFARQLREAGADVTLVAYPDHHAYTGADVAHVVSRAHDMDLVICTLKDAVKLAALWPRQAPALWYVSQRLELENGAEALDQVTGRLLGARSSMSDR